MTKSCRFPKIARAIFLVVFLQTGCKNSDRAIDHTGFKPYITKEPFHLLVKDKFPDDQSMMLLSTSNRIAFRISDSGGTKEAAVSVPAVDSSIDSSILLSKDNKPLELMLSLAGPAGSTIVFRDLNLDGIWDIKMILPSGEKYIAVDGRWVTVNKFISFSPGMEADTPEGSFIFDKSKGLWLHK